VQTDPTTGALSAALRRYSRIVWSPMALIFGSSPPGTARPPADAGLCRDGCHYVPQRRVEDGKFITCAGVSAGIDMAFALVARLTDGATAQLVQLAIEYDPPIV
jgi:hypothetical protein